MRGGPTMLRGRNTPVSAATTIDTIAGGANTSKVPHEASCGCVACPRIDITYVRFRVTPRLVYASRGGRRIVVSIAFFSMSSILDQIVQTKREEIAQRSAELPLETLQQRVADLPRPRNFFQAVTKKAQQSE